jgi:hypothetical protein
MKVSRPKGFTLVEAAAALFILMTGVLTSVQLYHFGLNQVRAINERAAAREVVQNELEWWSAQPFGALNEGGPTGFAISDAENAGLAEPRAEVFVRAMPGRETVLKEVEVVLRWLNERGRQQEYRQRLLVARTAARSGTNP